MAPTSASSQPSSEQPSPGRRAGRSQEEKTREGREIYGPLEIRRQTKDDGRALILYARREREGT